MKCLFIVFIIQTNKCTTYINIQGVWARGIQKYMLMFQYLKAL